MRIVECEQGTPEWLAARCSRITASRMWDVMSYNQPSAAKAKQAGHALVRDAVAAGVKGEESSARKGYRTELVSEHLTGRYPENYVSFEMKQGIEREPAARAEYAIVHGQFDIELPGFVIHPIHDFWGSSPDGIIIGKERGGIELKSPKATTHIEYIQNGVVPDDYIWQCHSIIACCELDWIDFASYCPAMLKEELRLFTVRLMRDESKIAEMTAEVIRLEEEIQAQIAKLEAR